MSTRKKGKRCMLAILLCICLLMPYAGTISQALSPETDSLCEHHTEHTGECGYQPAVEGSPCTHTHDAGCGYAEAQAEQPCTSGCEEVDENGEIIHIEGCGYQPAVEESPCTHTHDASCGYIEEQAEQPCTFVCALCAGAEQQTTVVSWSWVDDDGFLVQNGETDGWILELPGASQENPAGREEIAALLPKEIIAVLEDGGKQTLALVWDLSAIPEEGAWTGSYTLTASLPQDYALGQNVQLLAVTMNLGGAGVYVVDPAVLQKHIVTESVANPADTTVNLFDYWVDPQGEAPTSGVGANGKSGDLLSKEGVAHIRGDKDDKGNIVRAFFSGPAEWNRGINENHLLIFGDGVIHAGLWNKGAGENTDFGKQYAGMENIVKPILENGYPVINTANARKMLTGEQSKRNWELIKDWKLAGISPGENPHDFGYDTMVGIQNLSEPVIARWEAATGKRIANGGTESLDYLFDPDKSNPYKKVYTDVKGLFQLDDEGYYYYNMRENFAEFDKASNEIILYDAPATRRTDGKGADGNGSLGNFFPFNTGAQAFSGEDAAGNLFSDVLCSGNEMNHHLGMTISVDFRQPINGQINMGAAGNVPMTFGFTGDDDVWVFIDDVLVLDLGGVHSEIYGTIDFSTGQVYIGRGFTTNGVPEHPEDPATMVTSTTLRELFADAGKEDDVTWRENTFGSNTDHTLRMFYLERGNYDSSIAIRFNLQPRLYQQIKKVDQYGAAIKDVEFDLYAAELTDENDPDGIRCGNVTTLVDNGAPYYYIKQSNDTVLAKLKTGEDGTAQFEELQGEARDGHKPPFNFADRFDAKEDTGRFYILKETATPQGYRPLPIDIVLEYNAESTMITVANRWSTGAYASFTSTVTGAGLVTYGHFDVAQGQIGPDTDKPVSQTKQAEGLVVAIPMLRQEKTSTERQTWLALYGSNVDGFHSSKPVQLRDEDPTREGDEFTREAWREAALAAVLHQAAGAQSTPTTPGWFLEWDGENKRLGATLSDLPGMASRYQLSNPDHFDMRMVYAFIEPTALQALGINEATAEARYTALGRYINDKVGTGLSMEEAVEETLEVIMSVDTVNTGSGKGFSFLNVDQFNRIFRSLLYIPNEVRELRVQKVDQGGRAVNGAVFALYDNPDCSGIPVASGTTANVDGQDGVLIFVPQPPTELNGAVKLGYAEMRWAAAGTSTDSQAGTRYYLKEISSPTGYGINKTIIPVVVGWYSIYADAGAPDDGVTVMAGVGKLAQTMGKYASEGEVNITLRDISAFGQMQQSGSFDLKGWKDMALSGTDGKVKRSMNLHYGKNAVVDYGLHDEDSGSIIRPFFVTDTGYIRARVEQNYAALIGEQYAHEAGNNNANKDNLDGLDITSLFSLLNIVVVTDREENPSPTGQLTISKTVAGAGLTADDYTRHFRFTVELTDAAGTALPGEYYFYGTDKAGHVSSGDVIPLHHDESITILGLPVGTHFKITEVAADGWAVAPASGVIEGAIEEDVTAKADFFNTKEFSVTVSKRWVLSGDGKKSESVTVVLYRDGVQFDTVVLNEENHWTHTWTGLDQVAEWTAKEQTVPAGFTSTVTVEDGKIIITNSDRPGDQPESRDTSITVSKRWVLDNGGQAADSVTAVLYRDGVQYGTAELNASNNWTHTWVGLDSNRNWSVKEGETPDGFTSTVTRQGNSFTIINDDIPDEKQDAINVTVTKRWVLDNGGQAADSVTAVLYRDGIQYDTVVLSTANNWTHTWDELDKNNRWSVGELEVPEGFASVVTPVEGGFVITNDDLGDPGKPTEPGDPGKPGQPEDLTDLGDPDVPKHPGDGRPDLPKTGVNWRLVGALAIAGGALLLAGVAQKKLHRKENEK